MLEKLNEALSSANAENLKAFFIKAKEEGISAWKYITEGYPNETILPCVISTGV